MLLVCSSPLWGNISLYEYNTMYFSMLLFIGTWVLSSLSPWYCCERYRTYFLMVICTYFPVTWVTGDTHTQLL